MVQLLELGHSVGQLLHYGGDAQLRELVIREPQWLLDAICCVVRQVRRSPPRAPRGGRAGGQVVGRAGNGGSPV